MADSPTYPLLPYSQLVFDLQKSTPDIYKSEVIVRLRKKEVDIARLKQAVEKAIRNHPVFQMRVNENGLQQFEPPKDILHGQFHSVDFKDCGKYVDVHIKGNRILGDGRSDVLIIEDVVRAFQGMPLPKDAYLDYLKQIEEEKRSNRYATNKQWLEAEFGQLSCPVHPKTDQPIDISALPIEGVLEEDFTALRADLNRLAEEQLISLTAFFSLASALAMMEYNGCDEAALTWAYEGRERPEEQRIFGSLHRDVPFQINYQSPITNNQLDLIRQARNQIRAGIAHSSYPFTLIKPHTEVWNYALNVLVQPSIQEKTKSLPFPLELIEFEDTQHVAYSLLDVEVYQEERLKVVYRYSATHYKEESIQKFAALVRNYAEWLLEE